MQKRQFLYASLATLACPSLCLADSDYPSHLLKLVVNNPPGGASDIMARIFAQKCSEAIGASVIVDNRPGVSTGAIFVARQAPDGYTFMLGAFSVIITQPLLRKVQYNMDKDFEPVSLIATAPLVMVVNGHASYDDLKGFLGAARAKPKRFSYGTGGVGTLAHLLSETINVKAGLDMQHVPYRGSIQALNDLIAGQVQMVLGDPQAVLPLIQSGQLRALAVSSRERSALLPEVPSFEESGMPDVVGLNPWTIYLPSGVPRPVFDKFYKAVQTTMTDPGLVKKFAGWGVVAMHSTPEELHAFVTGETAKYAEVMKERNIKKI